MFRPLASSVRRPAARRGALLIAVLGLLTLFAIFALFFVFYADNEATSARIAREAETDGDVGPPDDFAIAAYNQTLRSLIFDELDTASGVMNPLRGHSLARTMFGWNGSTVGVTPGAPFSGPGTFHQPAPNGQDSAMWINYSAPFTVVTPSPQFPANTYWLDPEWSDWRLTAEVQSNTLPGTIAGRPAPGQTQTHVPKNAPYTYPDLKDLILASLSPATGEVLVPSLHRNWLFNANNNNPVTGAPNFAFRLAPWNPLDTNPTTFTSANTDWIAPEGRMRILRPRPVDQLTANDFVNSAGDPIPTGPTPQWPYALPYTGGANLPPLLPGLAGYNGNFLNGLYNRIMQRISQGLIIPYPPFNADGSFSGDVQNLMGGASLSIVPGVPQGLVQKNDSILVDIGLPPRKWNGKWIKPLASILVSDLDGLLNLSAHGNMRGGAATSPAYDRGQHASYNGFGPNEVSLASVLSSAEAVNIVQARYGINSWAPNTRYITNQIVVNAGNFYVCVNPPPIPAGPPPGWMSAPTGPGPTGSLPAPQAAPNDNQVIWQDWTPGAGFGFSRDGQNYLTLNRGGTRLSNYAPVNFDAGGNTPTYTLPLLPGTGGFQTVPQVSSNGTPQMFFDDNALDATDTYNKALNHPLLFNTHNFGPGIAGTRRIWSMSDSKRFNMRYAANPDYYGVADVARSGAAPTGLVGTPGSFPFTTTPVNPNSYRLDPAHTNRGLFTTFNTFLDRAHMPSNFNTSAGPLVLGMPPVPGSPHQVNGSFAGTFAGGNGADWNSINDWRNPRAAMGGIDLNRPLTDYRNDTTQPLSPANMSASLQPLVDRHNLARDILGRLIIASGANASVFSTTTTIGMVTYQAGDILINATVGSPDYNAIRYLAQIAVNMVDAIDNDDISTVFAWETGAAWVPPRTITQVDATSLPTILASAAGQTPTGLVFGVEKTRVVINEAYGEFTNGDEALGAAPTMNARVRFYVELMNPTSTASATGNGPIGSGSVTLYDPTQTFQPYQMLITREAGGTVSTALASPQNVTGDLQGGTPDITFNFSTANGAQRMLAPANGTWNNPPVAGTGFVMVGAQPWNNVHMDAMMNPIEFNPNTGAAPWNQMILGTAAGGVTSMEYNTGAVPMATDIESDAMTNPLIGLRRHVVLLRRLANPYQNGPTATNPYITVDAMDWVPAFDAIAKASDSPGMRAAKGAMNITNAGFEDTTNRYSIGKVQPYAGFANATAYTAGNNTFPTMQAFPLSMVVAQNPTTAPTAGNPKNTFFRMNGRNDGAGQPVPAAQTYNPGPMPVASMIANMGQPETLMAPFDWYVHFDRPLINQIELLSLQAVMPHQVTQFTLRVHPTTNNTLIRTLGLVPWLGMDTTTNLPGFNPVTNLTNNGLYRALETLRVKPWTYGMAAGGKQHGRVNINTMQDPRVLLGLLDPTGGNGRNTFTATDVNLLWTGQPQSGMMPVIPPIPGWITNTPGAPVPGSRTVNSFDRPVANGGTIRVPLPGPTYHDIPNSTLTLDRPFMSLGVGEYAADAGNTVPVARIGSGLQDTMFRVNGINGSPTFGAPLISVSSQTAPYMQAEMARKMFNNATTVSHAFGVNVTIVFHEVRMNGTNLESITEIAGNPRFLIGKEAFKDIPGDLRQQFFAIVDRTSLGLVPQTAAGVQVFQTMPFTAQFDAIQDVTTITTPSSPPPPPYIPHPTPPSPTYNLYLANRTPPASTVPYPTPGFPGATTIFMDGKPVVIGSGGYLGNIVVGTGANQEVMQIRYVNDDGSINVVRTNPSLVHAPGEVVSSFVTGNPGPVNPGNASNPGPFDPLNQAPNNPYRAVVPYAQRVR